MKKLFGFLANQHATTIAAMREGPNSNAQACTNILRQLGIHDPPTSADTNAQGFAKLRAALEQIQTRHEAMRHALELIAYDEHPCISNWQNTARGVLDGRR